MVRVGQTPGVYDVICNCRTLKTFDHIGNRRFRVIIENHSLSYEKAKTKLDKGVIVLSIMNTIKNAGGEFIRKNRKMQWEEVPSVQIREKIGHALRDVILCKENVIKNIDNSAVNMLNRRSIYDIIGGGRSNKIQLEICKSKGFDLKIGIRGMTEFSAIEELASSIRPSQLSKLNVDNDEQEQSQCTIETASLSSNSSTFSEEERQKRRNSPLEKETKLDVQIEQDESVINVVRAASILLQLQRNIIKS